MHAKHPSLVAAPTLALALAFALAPTAALAAATGLAAGKRRARRALLGERRREDLGRQVEHLAEVVDALVGEEIVVPTPIELLSDVCSRAQGPEHHHHMQVRHILQLVVPRGARVVLHADHALLEDML